MRHPKTTSNVITPATSHKNTINEAEEERWEEGEKGGKGIENGRIREMRWDGIGATINAN